MVAAEQAGSCRWRSPRRPAPPPRTAPRSTQAADTVVGITAEAPQADTVVAPPSKLSGAVGVAMSELGKPYVWAGSAPGQLRLLRPRRCTPSRGRQVAAALDLRAVQRAAYRSRRTSCSPATSSSSTGSATSASTSAAAQFVHAPHTGDVVKVSSLYEGWYASSYVGARRIL